MDAVWHGFITAGLSSDPLAIVASAINLRYTHEGIKRLRSSLSDEHLGLCYGISSHIEANKFSYWNEEFKAMQRQAAQALKNNGVPYRFSEVTMEATVDFLLLEETETMAWAEKIWTECNWDALLKYTPQFSRDPGRAEDNILYVRQRLEHPEIEHTAQWLWQVIENITRTQVSREGCLAAVTDLADMLRSEKLYHQVTREAQERLRVEIPQAIKPFDLTNKEP